MRRRLNEENLVYFLGGENFGSFRFRKLLQKAYMSENVLKYIVGNNVIFQQGAGRKVLVPIDIVQDIIGIIPDLPRRVA